jgi:hypothetical protein
MMLSTSKDYPLLPKRMRRSINRPSGKPFSFTRRPSSGAWPSVQRKFSLPNDVEMLIYNSLIMEGYDVTVLGSFYGHRVYP